jgi:two-component system sensor histidine kinase/response regulator
LHPLLTSELCSMTDLPESQLQELPTLPHWITDTLQVGLIVLDLQGCIVLFNRWMLKASGLESAQVVGLPLVDVFPEIAKGRVGQALRSCLSSGMPAVLSHTLHPAPFPLFANEASRAEGARLQQSVRILRSPKRAGASMQVLVEVSDVSNAARRERMLQETNKTLKESTAATQAALRESEALLSTLDLHGIVAVCDGSGNFVQVNDAFCQVSGFTHAELLGKNPRILSSGAHSQEFWGAMWAAIAVGQPWRGQVCNRNSGGGLYWVDTFIAPFLADDGRVEKFIAISTDITDSKINERELILAKDIALSAAQTKGQFLATMSHEIRTPMNAILGLLKLIQNTELTARQFDYISKTEGAAKSLLGLLNDILDFSKMDADKLQLEQQPIELDQLLRDLSVILSANVGQKPIEVLFDIDPALPKRVMGDAMRLQQVLVNLGGNAVKFTQNGEVLIQIRQIALAGGQATLRFSVQDSGIGIAPENQERIFSGFSQAEASTTRRFGGTGLGLAISRRLVELMGGALALDSELGRGSTFHFTLELPAAPQHAVVAHPHAALVPPGLQVLVVDDNPVAKDLLMAMAQQHGWQAHGASNGIDAMNLHNAQRLTRATALQAFFIDAELTGMDAFETLRQLHKHGSEQVKPVVVLVASQARDLLSQRSAAEQATVHAVLTKPLTASMMFDAVATALAERGQRGFKEDTRLTKPQRLAGMRLLVVEDNKINQLVASELLRAEGAMVELADNGQLGVAAIAQATLLFDAVLMDVQMPVMDGYAATHLIRHDLGLTDLPVIAMTANAMASDREACLAAGMNDHVGKPFDLDYLVDVLRLRTNRAALNEPLARVQPTGLVEQIDIDGALKRMGGNKDLLARTLQQYVLDLVSAQETFNALLAKANTAGLRIFLHTLKGLSATVGAARLAELAGVGESIAAQADAVPRLGLWRNEFFRAVAAVKEVVEPIAQALAQQVAQSRLNQTVVTVSPTELITGLENLCSLLRDSNMRALQVHRQLAQTVDTATAQDSDYQALCIAMESLDFEQALMHCTALLQS